MGNEKEEEFIDNIDGNFPFGDAIECSRIISESASISPKAAFKVIEEICTIEDYQREVISDQQLISMLSEIKRKFEHPLKDMIIEVATKMINKIDLSAEEAISKMEMIRKHPHQTAALWILTFSSYEDGVDEVKDSIYEEWNTIPE